MLQAEYIYITLLQNKSCETASHLIKDISVGKNTDIYDKV